MDASFLQEHQPKIDFYYFIKDIFKFYILLFLHHRVLYLPSIKSKNWKFKIYEEIVLTLAILISFITNCFPSALD